LHLALTGFGPSFSTHRLKPVPDFAELTTAGRTLRINIYTVVRFHIFDGKRNRCKQEKSAKLEDYPHVWREIWNETLRRFEIAAFCSK
jgi:hypothetical protein